MKAGVDPNETDYSQRTPLHIVAADGTAKDAEFLVHKGADVFAKDRYALNFPYFSTRLNEHSLEIAKIMLSCRSALKSLITCICHTCRYLFTHP